MYHSCHSLIWDVSLLPTIHLGRAGTIFALGILQSLHTGHSLPWHATQRFVLLLQTDSCKPCRHPHTVHELCSHALSLCPGIIVRYNLQRRILMDGRIVAKCYLWEGSMVADVVSTLPSILQVRCIAPALARFTAKRAACFCKQPRERTALSAGTQLGWLVWVA